MRLKTRLVLAIATTALVACDSTGPSARDFIGEYDLVRADGSTPPVLVRFDTVPFIYMVAVHLEVTEAAGWNWVMTMQHGLEAAAPTHERVDFGSWRVVDGTLRLAEQGYPDEMIGTLSGDQLTLSSCGGGFFGSCHEWVFTRAR